MANISGFRASIQNGLVRANQFRVDLNFPAFVTGGALATSLGQFHCKAASLPASNVAPVPVFYQGRSINVAGERDFQPWQIVVYNENFQIRDTFERWSNGINNISNNSGIIQPNIYTTDMRVKQLDRNGTILKECTMINAFPVEISPIQLDWEANNQVEMFEVTLVYDYYVSSGVNS
jgi:hypothetical protein